MTIDNTVPTFYVPRIYRDPKTGFWWRATDEYWNWLCGRIEAKPEEMNVVRVLKGSELESEAFHRSKYERCFVKD
jgi:hypothetical protein